MVGAYLHQQNNLKVTISFHPHPADWLPLTIRDSLADISKAGELMGFRPEIGVDEGLRRVWEAM